MTNPIETQPMLTIDPSLPNVELPQIPIDSTNPLAWILVMTMLLSSIDEPINAAAKLIRAIAALKPGNDKKRERNG
jgi:hypothetical protein